MTRARLLRRAFVPMLAIIVVLVPAAAAAPPLNDDYLQSIPINAPGSRLTQEQVKDSRDTQEAGVQSDLFSPRGIGGGVERTDCRGTQFGATVWYDFRPHADGTVRVAAAGFDAAIGVYMFDPVGSRIGDRLDCANEVGPTEELFVKVQRGKSYTIQVGGSMIGMMPATGTLDLTFEYLSDEDGDGVLDALDKCPRQAGTSNGCPEDLHVTPKLNVVGTERGVRVVSLSVLAPRGARVLVRCRHGCTVNQAHSALLARPLRFSRMAGRRLPVGARIEILVTRPQAIGAFIRYTITRGNFRRVDRCLPVNSKIPKSRCR